VPRRFGSTPYLLFFTFPCGFVLPLETHRLTLAPRANAVDLPCVPISAFATDTPTNHAWAARSLVYFSVVELSTPLAACTLIPSRRGFFWNCRMRSNRNAANRFGQTVKASRRPLSFTRSSRRDAAAPASTRCRSLIGRRDEQALFSSCGRYTCRGGGAILLYLLHTSMSRAV